MFGAITKLVHKFRSSGWKGGFKYVVFALFHRHVFVIFRFDLRKQSLPENLLPGFQVVSGLEELRKVRDGKTLDQDFFRDQIDGCRQPFLVLNGKDPAAIGWVYETGDKSRFFDLGQWEIEINYLYTLEIYRGNRIHGQLINYVLREYKSRGYAFCFMAVHIDNVNALKSMARQTGWEEIGRLTQYAIFRPKFRIAADA